MAVRPTLEGYWSFGCPGQTRRDAPAPTDATCLDQYNTNKTGTGNGGLKWIQKGGGYYSECNKRLKG